jgi:hypothetical protein
MPALGAAASDPVSAADPIKARLARRAQIEMVLQQQPQQLAAVAIDHLLKLGVLQRAAPRAAQLPGERFEARARPREQDARIASFATLGEDLDGRCVIFR